MTIPDSVITIGNYAFEGCSCLATVTIGDSVTTIGRYAFWDCTSLATVTIGSSVATIGDRAFYDCWSLTEVIIPDSLTTIGDSAFSMCSRLTEIHFEGDAPAFGTSVFSGVTATAYYPTGNKTWTKEVMKGYGGTITWVPVGVSIQCDSCTESETKLTVFVGVDVPDAMMSCVALYDKEGRFMRMEMAEGQIPSEGSIQLSISYTEDEAARIGRISAYVVDGNTWGPLCENWSKAVNFSV